MQPAPLRSVVNAVAYATCVRQYLVDDPHARSRRASPSAGALHPIEVVLVPSIGSARIFRYNPWNHVLEALQIEDQDEIRTFNTDCAHALPDAHGISLVMLGQPSCVAACYDDPMSLLWRDSGALLQTLFLTAVAFRLAFCPLGVLGHQIVRAIGLSELSAVGVARIGLAKV
jgi:hypothetical protein